MMDKTTRHPFTDQFISCVQLLDLGKHTERNKKIILAISGALTNKPMSIADASERFFLCHESIRKIHEAANARLAALCSQQPHIQYAAKEIKGIAHNSKRINKTLNNLRDQEIVPTHINNESVIAICGLCTLKMRK